MIFARYAFIRCLILPRVDTYTRDEDVDHSGKSVSIGKAQVHSSTQESRKQPSLRRVRYNIHFIFFSSSRGDLRNVTRMEDCSVPYCLTPQLSHHNIRMIAQEMTERSLGRYMPSYDRTFSFPIHCRRQHIRPNAFLDSPSTASTLPQTRIVSDRVAPLPSPPPHIPPPLTAFISLARYLF